MARASLALALLAFAATANATPPCNQFFTQKYVQPYAQQVVAYAAPLVQYYAGQDLQAEALAEKVARLVDKKLEVRIQQLSQSQQVKAAPQTMLGQHCSKCHSGATPKGGLTFDGLTPVPPDLALSALRAIRDEAMPKDHKIDAAVKGTLMEELLSLDSSVVARQDATGVRTQRQPEQPADLPPPAPVPQGQLQ
jgi:mono/diheme cytochrome c family protein